MAKCKCCSREMLTADGCGVEKYILVEKSIRESDAELRRIYLEKWKRGNAATIAERWWDFSIIGTAMRNVVLLAEGSYSVVIAKMYM